MKKELRNRIRSIPLSEEYRTAASWTICAKVLESEEYQGASVIFCYASTLREPDTRAIILEALAQGKTVLLPRCIGNGIMETVEIRSLEDLTEGSYGIYEPKNSIMSTDAAPEFSIIPCVCCDRAGNRLGHGGGYYDRFLKNGVGKTAVLCFERLMVEAVPVEAHDIRPDKVITEATIS